MNMKSKVAVGTRLAVMMALVVAFMVGLTSCCHDCPECPECPECPDCLPEADHWIAIHEAKQFFGPDGTDPATCGDPSTGETVAWLPACLTVNKGDTVGFYNFHGDTMTVEHFNSLNAPDATFDVAPNSYEIFEVVVEGTLVNFNFKSASDHGGPKMIVKP